MGPHSINGDAERPGGRLVGAAAGDQIRHPSFGHVVLAWIWLQQAVAAYGKTGDFYDGKRLAAQYFFHYELPKAATQFDLLDSGDRTHNRFERKLVLARELNRVFLWR